MSTTSTSQDGRDIIAVLTDDHRTLEALANAIGGPGTSTADPARDAVDRLIVEMVRHTAVEQLHLYPAVDHHVPGGDAVAGKGLRGLAQAEHLMKVLYHHSETDTHYEVNLNQLLGAIRGHIAETDGMVLPKLAAACPADELARLGVKASAAKRNAPTRPHPLTPNTPPFNRVLIPIVAYADRLRDTLARRGAHR